MGVRRVERSDVDTPLIDGTEEKKRKCRPSGRKTGKRWEIWPGGLRRVAGARPRPSAPIRMIGVDGDGENRIVPPAFQLPAVPCVALANERTQTRLQVHALHLRT